MTTSEACRLLLKDGRSLPAEDSVTSRSGIPSPSPHRSQLSVSAIFNEETIGRVHRAISKTRLLEQGNPGQGEPHSQKERPRPPWTSIELSTDAAMMPKPTCRDWHRQATVPRKKDRNES
jgi:hypothetical protein